VSDAFVAINNDGFTAKHGKYISLGTNQGARSAANAAIAVNLRVLRLRPMRDNFAFFRGDDRLGVALLKTTEMRD
jgi:hypothetical protein